MDKIGREHKPVPATEVSATASASATTFAPRSDEAVWRALRAEAHAIAEKDNRLSGAMNANILSHPSFASALACRLARTLANDDVDGTVLTSLSFEVFEDDPDVIQSAVADLQAVCDRDPSCSEFTVYFKGFLALQAHRISNWLWEHNEKHMARHLQSRMCEALSIDIHPAAQMGRGIMLDHGNGLAIGETAIVEDDVSILQDVTLGGTGKDTGDRHPKIRRGALIGAGAKILGNIEIGTGAKVAAGSVVVAAVEAHTSVAGVPAKVIGRPKSDLPGLSMDQMITEPE